jgi:hypothetical protein
MVVITLCNHENSTVILSTTHTKCYNQTTNSSSIAHPHLWQQHIADGMQTSIINLNQKLTRDKQKLPAIHTAHDTTVHLFSSWWHIQHFSGLLAILCFFYGLPQHCRCCNISQQTQPLHAIEKPCHKEKWRMCSKHTVCPPAKYRKKLSFSSHLNRFATTTFIMGNHRSDQSQHKFHPHFYSNAYIPCYHKCYAFHFTQLRDTRNNLNTIDFCH